VPISIETRKALAASTDADDGLAHVGKTRRQIRRCACGMTDASPRSQAIPRLIACLQCGGSLVAGRHVAEHDGWWNSRGYRAMFPAKFRLRSSVRSAAG